ncbi:unnamed protein product [Adineta ricciae]|uniref:EGF-like domain-containing protein n=1 Tax=Adineta ricciae TaxID=249248 RepID=A0A816EZA6_ADIRI|nr:unnamed protein product [Adineta ricciae]
MVPVEYNNSLHDIINVSREEYCTSHPKCHTLRTACKYITVDTAHINICSVSSIAYCFWEYSFWKAMLRANICPLDLGDMNDEIQTESFFTPSQIGNFPLVSIATTSSNKTTPEATKSTIVPTIFDKLNNWYCNRGILVRFNHSQSTKCLCPPSYFGSRCQWQNQRISLTLQLEYRTDAFINIVFQLIIMLLDEQRQITTYHEQITYIPKQDCGRKYNIYLLYPTKPKNLSANYSIHIDVFNKISLTYLASWHLPISFQFLPVNRIARHLFIPSTPMISKICSLSCGQHGRCVEYINGNFSYFCQCKQGYSGLFCERKYNCSCSSDSLCLSSSICVCPMNKFGSKCYLTRSICQPNPCQNHGRCVPIDDRIGLKQFICLCQENSYGSTCEFNKNRIDIQFDNEKMNLLPFVYVHFITGLVTQRHQQTSVLKKINIGQSLITIHISYSFHLVFIELVDRTYYLLILREKSLDSEHIRTNILTNYRCLSLIQLTNTSFANDFFLHRVKLYPLLCRQSEDLKCFYDEKHMCICDTNRFSNCFTFNTSLSHDCRGENICQHGGQCFQDNPKCPVQSVCSCQECYYGTKCQFSTKRFVFSLDSILGYHIQPNLSMSQQLFIIKICILITTIMFALGLANGLLSVGTFRLEKINQTGCSMYLLVSSWNSLVLTIVFYLKFWHLLLSQMSMITNEFYLKINCVMLDMLINVLISTNDWLYGCVAIERLLTVSQGVKFDQNKSKRFAKWISLCIFLMAILTHIQDPIHRQLIDDIDVDQRRTWCIAEYSSALNVFNICIILFHFLVPFLINLISTIMIILLMARSRSTIQNLTTFNDHLKQQFHKYKHHLITLCLLLILTLPRLIVSFISRCMKSSTNPWLFLLGYFLSFIPSMMTFLVFVLTAEKYKEEFNTAVQRTIRQIRTRFI